MGAPGKPPHSWTRLATAFAVLTLAAAVCLVLLVQFMRGRQMDITKQTAQMADNVESLLVYHRVPNERIQRQSPLLKQDDDAIWEYHEFNVDVPETLSVAGLGKVISKNLPLRNISVTESPVGPEGVKALELSLAGREFALVRLHQEKTRFDYTVRAKELADAVLAALRAADPAFESITTDGNIPRDSESGRWLLTRVSAQRPPGVSAQDAIALVKKAVQSGGVAVEDGLPASVGNTLVCVTYKGLTCVELTLAGGGEAAVQLPPVQLPAMPMNNNGVPNNAALEPTLPDYDDLPLESNGVHHEEIVAPSGPEEDTPQPGGSQRPRVAIIVDDGGYGGEASDAILGLDPALTLSVLPYCPHTADVAENAAGRGFEVMLHMPMQSHSKAPGAQFTGMLETGMDETEITKLTKAALDEVPHSAGVNNHTGSKFTADRPGMTAFMKELKARNMFFIDSRTTADTVGRAVARELGVPCAERNVFLDHESDLDYIRGQFMVLLADARERGAAIGICHFRTNSAIVLAEMLPRFKQEGVDVVHASELVK